MSNRVEELERQVAQLQAAVNGLTEELVETKERVRQLEDAEEERGSGARGPTGRRSGSGAGAGGEPDGADVQPGAGPRPTDEAAAADGGATDPDGKAGDGDGDESGDILVPTVGEDAKPAGPENSGGSEPGAEDGADAESDTDDGSDDIIVA